MPGSEVFSCAVGRGGRAVRWGVAAAGEWSVEVDADRMRRCWIAVGGNLAGVERWCFEVLENVRLGIDWKPGLGELDGLAMQHGAKWVGLAFKFASAERR